MAAAVCVKASGWPLADRSTGRLLAAERSSGAVATVDVRKKWRQRCVSLAMSTRRAVRCACRGCPQQFRAATTEHFDRSWQCGGTRRHQSRERCKQRKPHCCIYGTLGLQPSRSSYLSLPLRARSRSRFSQQQWMAAAAASPLAWTARCGRAEQTASPGCSSRASRKALRSQAATSSSRLLAAARTRSR